MEIPGLSTHRLEALTDGVFAIAMTLLVLNLHIPDRILELGEGQARQILIDQIPKFFHYAVSFILLAVFWITHHKTFHLIEKTDRIHTWINILFLMFVALIPFSTSLIGNYPDDLADELFFSANIFAIGALALLNWLYASRGRRLVGERVTHELADLLTLRIAVIPLVALAAAGVAAFKPGWAPFSLLLIPLILLLLPTRTRRDRRDD